MNATEQELEQLIAQYQAVTRPQPPTQIQPPMVEEPQDRMGNPPQSEPRQPQQAVAVPAAIVHQPQYSEQAIAKYYRDLAAQQIQPWQVPQTQPDRMPLYIGGGLVALLLICGTAMVGYTSNTANQPNATMQALAASNAQLAEAASAPRVSCPLIQIGGTCGQPEQQPVPTPTPVVPVIQQNPEYKEWLTYWQSIPIAEASSEWSATCSGINEDRIDCVALRAHLAKVQGL